MARSPFEKGLIGRRGLVTSALRRGVGLPMAAALGCTPPPAPRVCTPPAPLSLWSWFDLPDEPRSRELSGLAWEERRRVLWAVQDESPHIVGLVPTGDLRSWKLGPSLRVQANVPLDLEGIVVVPDGFIVSSESGPRILEVGRTGQVVRELTLPKKIEEAVHNKSLESLTASADGRYLYSTTEAALPRDGPPASASSGTLLRILRLDRQTSAWTEFAYATDPAARDDGDYGVAELACVERDVLLVLERGWAKGMGNTARVYRVALDDTHAGCGGVEHLGLSSPTLPKALVFDLALVRPQPDGAMPVEKQPQASPLLDNFEGLAVGPKLPDGRRSLLLVSDDNARSDQTARIVVFAGI